jgi:hypothetical protein
MRRKKSWVATNCLRRFYSITDKIIQHCLNSGLRQN